MKDVFFLYFALDNMFNKGLILIFFICFGNLAIGQNTFSVEALTIGVHLFKKPNLALYENSLDAEGNLCAEPGLNFSYESFISDNRVAVELSTAIFADAAGQMAGFTKIALKRLFFHKWRSSMYISVGPALTYRNSWSRLNYGTVTYTPEAKYYVDGNWEILPTIIGKFEYDLFLGRRSDVKLGIYYGNSYKTFTASLGYRYWITTKVKRTRKCDCKDKYKRKFWDLF